MTQVKVWDVPTRLFHWALVTVFVFQFISGDILDDAMQLHFYGGYVALGLIVFRIIWGFVGSYHARFSHFIYSPSTAIRYMQGKTDTQVYLGHNPMGGYSVLAILAVMLSQGISGLFMTDDIFLDGPYHGAFSSSVDDAMNLIHHNAILVMWGLIALHLCAIVYYSFKKKQALVPAMIHGNKANNDNNAPVIKTHWLRFIACAALAAVSVYLVVSVLAPAPVMDWY